MLGAPTPAAPRIVRYISRAALVIGILLTLVGTFKVGVTWDEPLHVQRFNNYSHTGWYLGDGQLDGDRPGPAMTQQFVYGPATMLILNGLGAATGVEHLGTASRSADAYTVRHLGVFGISVLGVLAVIGTGRLLFRRWDWAVVAGATLATLPMWTGHAMFNLKDVPVATGYALVTYGLAALARADRRAHALVRYGGPAAIAAGIFLAVGTRPGMWTGVFGSTFALVCCLVLRPEEHAYRERLGSNAWRARDLIVGLVVGALGLLLIYPRVFSSPISALVHSAMNSSHFTGTRNAPRAFVPVHVLLQVPILMLGFIALATVVCARRFVRQKLRLGQTDTVLVLACVQTFFLTSVPIVHGANFSADLRQLLFAAPSTALLISFGMSRLTAAGHRANDRFALPLIASVASVALVVPLIDQAMLFPYDYAYMNPISVVAGVSGDGDFYRASGPEIVSAVPAKGRVVCSPELDEVGARRQAHVDGFVDCRDPDSSPLAAFRSRMNGRQPPLSSDQFWAVTFYAAGDVPANCVKVKSTHRRAIFRDLPLATLSRCTRSFPVLSTRSVPVGVRSKKRIEGLLYLNLGWRSTLVDLVAEGVLSRGRSASMTFRLDRQFRGAAAILDIKVDFQSAFRATFGGVDVDVRGEPGSGEVAIALPAPLVAKAIATAQTLTFSSVHGEDLGIRLKSFRAVSVRDGNSS